VKRIPRVKLIRHFCMSTSPIRSDGKESAFRVDSTSQVTDSTLRGIDKYVSRSGQYVSRNERAPHRAYNTFQGTIDTSRVMSNVPQRAYDMSQEMSNMPLEPDNTFQGTSAHFTDRTMRLK
jgi:hypothetical protein